MECVLDTPEMYPDSGGATLPAARRVFKIALLLA